ncbi:LON peptidase substrate-binding domain-containing protein [Vibrio methylphosphonaticus]|uniref:LON peptidase substrate-binding domain-containing protein n=1 Tax=Vibrio methylphosphonaticus TaxID=2946866 RepID=UPI00202A3A3D|nr:LON peptidase substrate-binding domain-containing protein [Vibrio methylphosphonaticus]MCL9773175.1 LON peptidase substrate-binding domain-containing protein [Vibrio methylphosphonaticus]
MSQIMLFPLGSIVLPEGKMKLRIFEPRYKRMVTQCLKESAGFGMCLIDESAGSAPSNVTQIGTFVSIVDFEVLEGGLLGITVSGIKRFLINNVVSEHDGLRVADVDWLPSWQPLTLSKHQAFIGERLQEVYNAFPTLESLYLHCFYDDATWVSQRWLEVLPVSCHEFEQLVAQPNCEAMLSYIEKAITKHGLLEPKPNG